MGSRCPLTWGLFLGTAALVIRHKKRAASTTPTTTATLPASEVVFVLGAPGTGKGTQCELLEERLDKQRPWKHLSAGDLLRAERDAGTGAMADLIRSKIEAGAIVPSSITVKLLENAMAKAHATSGATRFLIDGFPRSHENMQAWEEAMAIHAISFVLNFECPEEVLVGRLLERAKESGRSDDNIEVIRKRFKTHVESTVPILDYFGTQLTPLHNIDSAKSIEQVYESVVALFA